MITRMSLEEESDICGDQDGDGIGLKEQDKEEAKTEERLRMLLVNMLELAERQSRWAIKADKVEEEWKEVREEVGRRGGAVDRGAGGDQQVEGDARERGGDAEEALG